MTSAGLRSRRSTRATFNDEYGYSFRPSAVGVVPVLFGPLGTPVLDNFNSGTPSQNPRVDRAGIPLSSLLVTRRARRTPCRLRP
jgi:hypothetical protein